MIDLTKIIQFFISVIILALTTFLVPYIKRKINEKDRDDLLEWVDIAVAAAQQMLHACTGADRKEYVRNFLNSKGFDVNSKEVDAAIEAAVLRLHQELV